MRVLLLILCLGGVVFGQQPEIRLVEWAGGFSRPTVIADAGDGSGRLYIVEQAGRVMSVSPGGERTMLLDIRGRVLCCSERGLLGLAFPPDFAAKQHFYVYYTDLAGDLTISRFRADRPGAADPGGEQILLTIPHRQFSNHNGGQLAFGPDGFLYIGTGDGGGGGDPLGNGQDLGTMLGALLRIDVENTAGAPYQVPPSNPFVSRTGARPEIWAFGLRNPWRFSFDRQTGDLWIGDVGQNRAEEVNFQAASSSGGENYGWNRMEGLQCFRAGCSTNGLTLPVLEYPLDSGNCSVTGGYVVRGGRLAELEGTYIYGDYCSGRIWAVSGQPGQWRNRLLLDSPLALSTFGQSEAGDLYAADLAGGVIYRIDPVTPSITADGVGNAASFEAGLTPGSLGTVFGAGWSSGSAIQTAQGFPLPSELSGVRVRINGAPVPLLAVAGLMNGDQVNFQVPWSTPVGEATVTVEREGVASASQTVTVTAAQPALFATGGFASGLTAANRSLANCEASGCPVIEPGGIVQLFGTGLGLVDFPPGAGTTAPDQPLSRTIETPMVTVGGRPAEVLFSGLAPRFAGLYQLNLRLAQDTPMGQQDVVVTIGGKQSAPVKLRVGQFLAN